MTNAEAIELLAACKPLAERVTAAHPGGVPLNFGMTEAEVIALQGFDRVHSDPISAGPGLLGKLEKAAGLTQVEVYKLEQLRRMVFKRRSLGRSAATGQKMATE
jgi:hypothetical protein